MKLYTKSNLMIFDLESKKILEKLSIENCPVGMGGCKSQGHSYDCCEYDITIFDGKKQKSLFLNLTEYFIIFIMECCRKHHLIFYCSMMV
uniref:Uncharacterized protein n=1 Tax=uncultured marine thaumarchaeote KM3_137_A09 TaxID=1456006 RepID=A0A075GBG3_9ARCH|nr:hypothetical protein [uncultured marine thaumarchaeote KM3_137_A09]